MMMTDSESPVLSASGLGKDYGQGPALVRAVRDVDLEVASGESVAIVGPSGCGKSTLLYLLGGLERASSGRLELAGEQLERLSESGLARLRRHALGFVFQAFQLVEELTALENVELPALLAIARALANEPLVVLADQPTGNLDSAATSDVLRLFEQLRAGGRTLAIVTHDDRIAATADRLNGTLRSASTSARRARTTPATCS